MGIGLMYDYGDSVAKYVMSYPAYDVHEIHDMTCEMLDASIHES